MSIVEIMVAMAIVLALLGLAAPNFASWIQSSQIRTAADGILNGLQLAKSEAVRRNTPISLYLTTSIDNSCAVSNTGTSWLGLIFANSGERCCMYQNLLLPW